MVGELNPGKKLRERARVLGHVVRLRKRGLPGSNGLRRPEVVKKGCIVKLASSWSSKSYSIPRDSVEFDELLLSK
jgi:hypothetical protein